MVYEISLEEAGFFGSKTAALGLYEIFAEKLYERFPDIGRKVQKTQITFTCPKVFACISMAKVRKAKERPKEYVVVTFGLGAQVQSDRIDVATEPYPGRWTHHVLVAQPEEIDDELLDWVQAAYDFARVKTRTFR